VGCRFLSCCPRSYNEHSVSRCFVYLIHTVSPTLENRILRDVQRWHSLVYVPLMTSNEEVVSVAVVLVLVLHPHLRQAGCDHVVDAFFTFLAEPNPTETHTERAVPDPSLPRTALKAYGVTFTIPGSLSALSYLPPSDHRPKLVCRSDIWITRRPVPGLASTLN
jgi:hypothetical protein